MNWLICLADTRIFSASCGCVRDSCLQYALMRARRSLQRSISAERCQKDFTGLPQAVFLVFGAIFWKLEKFAEMRNKPWNNAWVQTVQNLMNKLVKNKTKISLFQRGELGCATAAPLPHSQHLIVAQNPSTHDTRCVWRKRLQIQIACIKSSENQRRERR